MGPQQKKTHGAVFFFLLRPRADAHSLTAGLGGASPSPGWCFFFCCGPARTGVVFFFCCGPAQTLTHSLWAGAISARFGWCFFFCCGPARSFLVSLKRPGGAAAKKNPRGGVFFVAAAPRGRSLTHCGPGWCLPLAGVVFFFFCCGPARTGVVFFFLLRPRPDRGGVIFFAAAPRGRSLTHCGPGWCLPLAGVVFFFFAAAPPGPGWCFFFCCGPARTLTHSLWAGAISARFGWCFFFCCGPARSFLDSLKRPGGAAAKKNTGRCFFAAAPRGRSLTHCGPGWCLPLAGAVFFFFAAAPPGPGWCFFFCCGPARTLTHSLWAGAISARFGWCFFFCCGPARSFLVSLKRPGGAAAKKKRGGVFFFLLRPRADAHSLTAGLGGASPSPGWCFFFFAAAPPGPGWCFFFCCGPARTLTHSLWAGAISARFGWCFFFLLWPRPVFFG